GTIMILMALDHVRDFWGAPDILDATNMQTTWPALFFTRWITHFCAPNFIFLAGVGAFLAGTRGQSKLQVAWLLLTRGIWLAIFELTLVQGSWQFNFNPLHHGAGVFWAIGCSMVVLSVLVFLPTWMIAAFGVGMIALHNLSDGVSPEQMGALGGLWKAI